jgi:hypothetical protein
MACNDVTDRARRRCLEWQTTVRAYCSNWRTTWEERCTRWETEWEQRCDRWRTETERVCDRWEEERYQECSDWGIFSFLCIAWVWVSSWVCRAWSWATTTICEAWGWASTTVCRAWGWISTTICTLWLWISTTVCRLWVLILDLSCLLRCFFRRLAAPQEFSESKSECIYGWTSAYRAVFDPRECHLQVTVRIRLVPDSDVSATDLANCIALWEPTIEAAWTDRFPLVLRDGTCGCKVVTVGLDVNFVTSGEHHVVAVHSGAGRADMGNFFVNSTGGTAAHEVGHMIGNADEYADAACPARTVTSDGSIMQTSQRGSAKCRHYESFQRWLSNRTCCIYSAC